MNFNRLSRLNNLVTNDLRRKPTIILEPNYNHPIRMFGTAKDVNVNFDTDDWIISQELTNYVENLAKSNGNIEDKILKIYQKLCEDYTYDDNTLSYIKKNDDDTFYLPDEYGRNTDDKWKENREQHNRRNCFEISRILAKSISELIRLSKSNSNYDVCILWDEAVTHYFVGFTSDDYCASLDIDDFTQIKDLTRVKAGLTIEGIKVFSDKENKFTNALDNFNKDRTKSAKEYIENKVENEQDDKFSDDVLFFQYAIQILKEEHKIDSAGLFEYAKELVDTKIGGKARKKVWKKIENNPGQGDRYTRCLVVELNDSNYIIDTTEEKVDEVLKDFDEVKKSKNYQEEQIVPFSKMSRNWKDDPYDGR